MSLAQVANTLHQQEAALLDEQSRAMLTNEQVGLDGNYSIQVITMALRSVNDIACTPIFSTTAPKKPFTEEEGFFAHKGNHWIAIRKVDNVWYNLNSTNIVPPGPQYISDFQLDAFLSSIQNSGFTIYIV